MLSKYSVKKPYTVIVGIILVIVLGYISFTKMTTDLLPSMNLPYVVVYTTYVGATPEQVESEVTRPMEAAFATLTDVKKLTSSSRDNVSVVIMQFNDGANMDTALIEISSRLDQLRGGWDDAIGAPVTMKLNPDMLPVAILSVTRDDADILALSDYVEDELVPAFESLNGVASASASGVIQQRVDVTIEQGRIDVLNRAILRDVDEQLADAERQLDDAQAQLSAGKRQLAAARSQAYGRIDEALAAIDEGSDKIKPAIKELTKQRAELVAQRDQVAAAVAAMDALVNMDDTQKAALKQMQQNLAALKQQLATLEQQLADAEAAQAQGQTSPEQADLQAQRDALAAELARQQQYISDLGLLDPAALQQEIANLESQIATDEAALALAQEALAGLQAQRDALQAQIDELTRRIAEAATPAPADTQAPAPTDAATPAPTDAVTPAPEATDTPVPENPDEPTPATEPTDAQPSPSDEGGQDGTAETVPPATDVTAPDNTSETTDAASPADTTPGNPSESTDAQSQPSPSGEGGSPQSGETEEVVPSNEASTPAEAGENTASSPETSTDTSTDTSTETSPEVLAPEAFPDDAAPSVLQKPSPSGEGGAAAPEEVVSPSPSADDADPSISQKPSPLGAKPSEQSERQVAPAAPEEVVSPSPSPSPDNPDLSALPFSAHAEETSQDALRAQLEAARQSLEQLVGQITTQSGQVDTLSQALEQARAQLQGRRDALATMTQNNEDIQSRLTEAQRQIEALNPQIAALDERLAAIAATAASGNTVEALRQSVALLNEQIAAIEGSDAYKALAALEDPESLNAQYAEAQAGLAQLDAGIAQIDSALEKLNKGIIPGGFIEGIDEDTNLSDAKAQLENARRQADSGFGQASSQIAAGEAELAKARKEFNEQRDEALENAGLDGVITVQMVSGLIGAQNFAMPAGYVYDADSEQVLVRVGNKFDTLDALRRMKLFDLGLDSIDEVRLLDVASVELADDRDEVFTKLNGSDGILLSMDKQSTYSTADVAETILKRADELMAADPSLHIVDLMNQGEYINIIVDSVLDNLISGGGLAILILLLFLMDFRPTITVAFSIPISVVIAFVCMYFSGITLNVLSLSGLSLGIGMLVDNSIVSIENIYRLHDEEGVPLLRACVEGVKSVSGALFSSTLTTICVFLPIVFVQGMARDLFADMGLTIAYSLLASLFVAMTVVPAMCSFLMRKSKPHKHRIFGTIQRFYTALLRGALRFKPVVLLAALGLLAFSAMQVPKMGISFMPQVNSRQMSANLALDPELTDAQQKQLAVDIMNDMMAVEGVESVGLMGGSGGMLGGLSDGGGMSYYIMVDESLARNEAIAREMTAIGERRGADLSVQASTMDISMLTGSGISVEVTGDEIETLQSIAADVAELARQTEGVVDVDDGLEDAVPEMRIEVNKEKAIDQGLTTAQVFQFIAQKLAGRIEITQATLDGKSLSIYLQDGASRELRPEDLEDLEIEVDAEGENKLVRIGDIASVRQTNSLSTINRADQRRLVTVSFGIAEGYSANLVSDDFAEKLKGYSLPAGYSAKLAGENETVMGIMEDLVWMVLVAILLIFLIMVAQFQSFKSPIIVMFTIPLAFTGGLLALLLSGMDLSIVSMLGFLVLSGVVVNNGIVFIDCVNQLRIGGMEKREALIETGRIRLRPILMTALTTILGMSTMALGRGTGAEMMQPMAVVSIGGLSYATLMTLFVVPVLYDLLNSKTMRAREIQMIKEAAGMTGDEILDGDTRAAAETAATPEPSPMGAKPSEQSERQVAPAAPEEVVSPMPSPLGAAPVTDETASQKPSPLGAEPSEQSERQVAPVAPEEVVPVPTPAVPTPALPADAFKYTPTPKPVRVKLSPKRK